MISHQEVLTSLLLIVRLNNCGYFNLSGFFEKAAHEHKLEIQLSEAAQDKIGTAIAHRKVGECLCEMGKYKDALFHQNLHLEVILITI